MTVKNIIYSFTEFTHFCICSFAFMYLLIYLSMNKFCKFYLIMNSQSNLFIGTKFVLYKFDVCLILHFCVCICVWVCYIVCLRMFVRVFVFICVLPVASVLAAFVLPPFWLCFSKTIREFIFTVSLKILAKGKKVSRAFFLWRVKPLLVVIKNCK